LAPNMLLYHTHMKCLMCGNVSDRIAIVTKYVLYPHACLESDHRFLVVYVIVNIAVVKESQK